jgi:hypothetical protein
VPEDGLEQVNRSRALIACGACWEGVAGKGTHSQRHSPSHRAQPHPQPPPGRGKNYLRTFTHPRCPLRARFPALPATLALQSRYDPDKVFQPTVFGDILEGRPYKLYPQCALSKDCFCASDGHCPKGMACRASKAHPEYKACKPDWDEFEASVRDMAGWRGMWARWKATGNPVANAEQAAAQKVLGLAKTRRRRQLRRR